MKRVQSMSDQDILSCWAQYGRPPQACFYPGSRRFRATLWAEMKRRGLTPPVFRWSPRPNGYGADHGGYMFFWGLGGDFPAPKLP